MKINFRLVLISGLILLSSFFASIMADMKVRESLRSSFIGLANLVEGEIAYQLQMTSNSMEQVRAMILVSSKLNSEKFNKYLKYSRQSQKHFPLSHVGYIELLPGDKEKRSVERLWPGLKNDFAHYESSEKDFEIAPGHKFMMAETIREAIRTGSVQSTIINLKPIGQEALEHGFIFLSGGFFRRGATKIAGTSLLSQSIKNIF